MGHRRQQGAAQLFGFAMQSRGLKLVGQLRPGQRLSHRLAQRHQQTPPLGAEALPLAGPDAKQGQRPFFSGQRPPPPGAGRQSAGATPGRLVVLPGPVRSGTFRFGQLRLAALHFPATLAVAINQADVQFLPAGKMQPGSTDHRLPVGGGGELARQVEQLAGFFLRVAQRLHLPALARRKITGEGRHEQEKQQRQHVLFALDGQRKTGRHEQKIVSQKRQDRRRQRRPDAGSHGNQQHGGEKHQRDVGQVQHAGDCPGQGAGQHRGK